MNARQTLRARRGDSTPRPLKLRPAQTSTILARASLRRLFLDFSSHAIPFLERHVDDCCIGPCSELATSMSHGGDEGVHSHHTSQQPGCHA